MKRVENLVIRDATDADIERVGQLSRISFNIPTSAVKSLPQRYRASRYLVAEDAGRIVATTLSHPMHQWFGGSPVPTSGIAGVTVDPVYRGTGVGSRLVGAMIRKQRDAGMVFSSLYPATVPVYRRLGYEYGGIQTKYRVPIAALPSGSPPLEARELTEHDDLEPMKACFRRIAATENGLVEGTEDDWWPNRVLSVMQEEARGAVTVGSGSGSDAAEGYAAYVLEDIPDRWGYRVSCTHLMAENPDAARSLLAFFRRFRGVGMDLDWHGPPAEPLATLFGEQVVKPVFSFRMMARILDVAGALEARGYPSGPEGEVTFAVEDPLLTENRGRYRLEASDGKVRVERLDDDHAEGALAIGALSTLYTGYLSVPAAARVGLIGGDEPGLDLLGRLFAGPAPWLPDWF